MRFMNYSLTNFNLSVLVCNKQHVSVGLNFNVIDRGNVSFLCMFYKTVFNFFSRFSCAEVSDYLLKIWASPGYATNSTYHYCWCILDLLRICTRNNSSIPNNVESFPYCILSILYPGTVVIREFLYLWRSSHRTDLRIFELY